jgi:hypothetical protein
MWLFVKVFPIVLLALTVVFIIGWRFAIYKAKKYVGSLSKPIVDGIISDLEKGLAIVTGEPQRRLSQFEINSLRGLIGGVLKKQLEAKINSALMGLLLTFFIAGIVLFSFILFSLFYYLS